MKRLGLLFSSLLLLAGCTTESGSGISGELRFAGSAISGATVEVYLKSGKDRKTQPFVVGETGQDGRYQLKLPSGNYFIIGKKRENGEDGRPRMLMAECPTNPVAVENGMVEVPPFALQEMGRSGKLVPEPGTALLGRVVSEGEPVTGAFVYVYTEASVDLKGPSYATSVQTDDAGTYRIPLPQGEYWLAARKRGVGGRLGEPTPGDLNGVHPDNPVRLSRGSESRLADLTLRPVSNESFQQQQAAGKFATTETAFVGLVANGDGEPVDGIYLFAYIDSGMVGKPSYISAQTGGDGRFRINLGSGGSYYIGARSNFGGPLEPGEWVGTFDGRADHRADIASGRTVDLGVITVREIW